MDNITEKDKYIHLDRLNKAIYQRDVIATKKGRKPFQDIIDEEMNFFADNSIILYKDKDRKKSYYHLDPTKNDIEQILLNKEMLKITFLSKQTELQEAINFLMQQLQDVTYHIRSGEIHLHSSGIVQGLGNKIDMLLGETIMLQKCIESIEKKENDE